MNLPNIITIGRILLVPVTIWLIVAGQFGLAFLVFIMAGVGDGIDGFIARRYSMKTKLGAYLDPLADKLLLVSIYISLGFLQHMPAWLVILVASRDVLIVGAVILSWILDKPIKVQPLMISKVNTVAQIIFAGGQLAILAWMTDATWFPLIGSAVVAFLTIASAALYLREWARHMANGASTREMS
jgi:cardiolipin synthase